MSSGETTGPDPAGSSAARTAAELAAETGARAEELAVETQVKADDLAAEAAAKAGALATEATERAADLARETSARAEELAAETSAKAAGLAIETAAKALELATQLTETLDKIGKRLEEYAVYGRRSRRIIIALTVSFALDIVLTIVLGFTAFSAHSTASTNASLVSGLHTAQVQLRAAQLEACAGGNTFRADQDIIWEDFIHVLIAKPAAGTPESQIEAADKLAAQFLAYVAKVNHPVNCEALYGN